MYIYFYSYYLIYFLFKYSKQLFDKPCLLMMIEAKLFEKIKIEFRTATEHFENFSINVKCLGFYWTKDTLEDFQSSSKRNDQSLVIA